MKRQGKRMRSDERRDRKAAALRAVHSTVICCPDRCGKRGYRSYEAALAAVTAADGRAGARVYECGKAAEIGAQRLWHITKQEKRR